MPMYLQPKYIAKFSLPVSHLKKMLSLQLQQTDEFLTNPFLLLLISFLLVWTLKKYIYKPHPKRKLPPSPPTLPILGNLHQLSVLTHRSLQSLGTKYGPLILLHFGRRPVILVQSAAAASEIIKKHDLIFANKPETSIARRLFYNMRSISVAPYGEYWRKLKSVCIVQLLSNKRVQSFRSIREEEIDLLMRKIESCCLSCSPVNLSELFVTLANDVICRSAFGRRYSEGEDGKKFLMLLGELLHLSGSVSIGEFIPWLSWINSVNGFDYRVDRVAKGIDEFLEAVIEEHLNAGLKNTEEANKENFVDILLNIYMNNITGLSIDRESIKAITLDMFAGGTDTTFATLEWAMTELLKNRMIMEKLQDEVKQTLHGKQDIADEDLEKMQYLKAVVKETLRFHSPVPFMARESHQDVEIMGYDIAAGTMVLINTWAIGRDHGTWDEADKFQPERFLNCSIDFKGFDFELIPFGAGRRGCPGIAFSMANIELVLANLMQKFDWKLPNGATGKDLDCVEDPGITLHRKNPLLALPTQRDF